MQPCLLVYVQENNLDGDAELGEGAGSRRHRRLGSGGVNDRPERWQLLRSSLGNKPN
jgi:hypothetical protein